ncbi:hypothetical protein [Telmatospirillum sp.]|uniref:hypothetical protein n=1 Tax=Telmatospirillum sp. TaxID=2079197 RepID=UPI002841F70B|nr:hypothetical protein [Telmatospirillum sp.]MDR3440799.1 hypothetical protein [Telmatospirillum sp.]
MLSTSKFIDSIKDPLTKAIFKSLFQSEVSGKDANVFELSKAPGKSGWSFGPLQYDLIANPNGVDYARNLLKAAGIPVTSAINTDLNSYHSKNESDLSQETKDALNQAMTTLTGQTYLLDQSLISAKNYILDLTKTLERTNNLNLMNNQSFMLYLADYANQYGIDKFGKLVQFLSGQPVLAPGHNGYFYFNANSPISSLLQFILATKNAVINLHNNAVNRIVNDINTINNSGLSGFPSGSYYFTELAHDNGTTSYIFGIGTNGNGPYITQTPFGGDPADEWEAGTTVSVPNGTGTPAVTIYLGPNGCIPGIVYVAPSGAVTIYDGSGQASFTSNGSPFTLLSDTNGNPIVDLGTNASGQQIGLTFDGSGNISFVINAQVVATVKGGEDVTQNGNGTLSLTLTEDGGNNPVTLTFDPNSGAFTLNGGFGNITLPPGSLESVTSQDGTATLQLGADANGKSGSISVDESTGAASVLFGGNSFPLDSVDFGGLSYGQGTFSVQMKDASGNVWGTINLNIDTGKATLSEVNCSAPWTIDMSSITQALDDGSLTSTHPGFDRQCAGRRHGRHLHRVVFRRQGQQHGLDHGCRFIGKHPGGRRSGAVRRSALPRHFRKLAGPCRRQRGHSLQL